MNISLIETTLIFAPLIFFLIFFYKRLRVYMLFYQQEEYSSFRYLKTVFKGLKLIDKKLTAFVLMSFFAFRFYNTSNLYNHIVSVFWLTGLIFFAIFEKNPNKFAKKKLVMTSRAKRIFLTAYAINMLILYFTIYHRIIFQSVTNSQTIQIPINPLMYVISIQLIPFTIILGNWVLLIYEKLLYKKFYNEAFMKVRKLKPFTIGITGSYGKTTVKHILNHILSVHGKTLMTPGSVNTHLGIARIVREKLREDHRYFIVEMGAYYVGSIKEKCELTPPDLSIITAVGDAHYERFKSIDNVAKAKFEIAKAAIQNKGGVIINAEMVDEKYLRLHANPPEKFTAVYSGHKIKIDDKYELKNLTQTEHGLSFTLDYKDETTYNVQIPIWGEHNAYNAALAFLAAKKLGISHEAIIASLKTTPQIQHRLEVKKQGSITIIDNAYNSNPEGFKNALKLMDLLSQNGNKRKILITPGVVELGRMHDEVHNELGRFSAEYADVVLLVNPNRIPTFIEGFYRAPLNGKIMIPCKSFKYAQDWINQNVKGNAVLLYENDLPDVYEHDLNL